MFDFVRRHNRLLQLGLLVVILPSFALFGIQGYQRFTEAAAKDVATIGRTSIKQGEFDAEYRRQIEQIRQRSPEADVKSIDTPEARREVLEMMVRDRVSQQTADRLHMGEAINEARLERLFQTDPQYAQLRNPDGSVNRELLASQGMSSATFAARLKQDLATRQVMQAVSSSSIVTRQATDATLAVVLQQREIVVKRFDAAAYTAAANPSDAEVAAYYKDHESLFREKEKAEIEYVVLDPAALARDVTVSEDDLRKFYDENAARYTDAEERRASHILVKADKSEPQADRDKAKAKAEALLAEVRAKPSSFAEVAKRNSDDAGSAKNGGDLDFFGRGAMVKPFEDAAFAMKPGEISPVVQSDFGYHIIELTAVRGGTKKPFDAVRADIEAERRQQLAQQRFTEAAESFTNTVYEQPDSLDPAIQKWKLVKKTATVERQPAIGATGPLASPKLLEAVFSSDALRDKRNTQAIDVGNSQLVSARVLKSFPERTPPLAEVKVQVTQAVRAVQAAALARKDGEALLAAVRAGGAIPDAKPIVVSRVQPAEQPRQVVVEALKADVSKGPATLGIDLAGAGYVVVRVERIVPRTADDPQTTRAGPLVAQAVSAAETEAYYEALKARYKVKLMEPATAAN